ncbi:related to bood POZ containing protein [Fusarium torulosum]|uniref:Related to bood POZ containing protein n=1 Tax=Fusarium torulosum TaxID=33205 RepID=A0AAE8M9N0_9HYPO|nr:related to bood POZ containing protein [Fusarium torulosum]
MVLRKFELEGKLGEEARLIESGVLLDENPLDESAEFHEFLMACRRGDLRRCQELISEGVNINGKDRFDYTPLIIASLCGHYELVQLLLESGALAERNTFQGERCIYNALNDRIRNLLLQYDFSKSSDPYVYWSTHISTLLGRTSPKTTDITLASGSRSFDLHKFILVARSPYFRAKLAAVPETTTWKLASAVPVQSFLIVLRYLYLGEVPRDIASFAGADSEEDVLKGLYKVSKQLEVESLWETILAGGDRRLARQRYQAEVERARGQFEDFFNQNVLGNKMVVDTDQVKDVKWKYDNSMFADVILRADEPIDIEDEKSGRSTPTNDTPTIPIGPARDQETVTKRKSVLYPAHKAMLIRSEYFEKMFSGDFVESQRDEHLRIVTIDCTPAILEIILTFLYAETAVCPLEHALDLLYAADMLFLDNLKSKAALAISTLGSGTSNVLVDRTHGESQRNGEGVQEDEQIEMEPINIYDVIHAAWDLRVQRLEEFAARYLAYRLEDYIDEEDFQNLIAESAQRITVREETDTIELLDDIRYYLGDRFRLRFEDAGIEEMMDETREIDIDLAAAMEQQAGISADAKNGVPEETHNGKVINGNGNAKDAEAVRTLDGAEAEDEFASDAINYQILQRKIDAMLDRLKLDA